MSVIIPAYQSAMYIGAAVESVLTQTFEHFELFVINDGSPDTEELERVLDPYPDRILYFKQENRGPAGARNVAILKARGQYVAFLDSDDMWMPESRQQMMALKEDPSLDLIYADALVFHGSSQLGQTFMEGNPSQGPVTFESLICEKCVVITSCVLARRQALIDAGLFDESFLRSEDYDLWLRLAHRGGRLGAPAESTRPTPNSRCKPQCRYDELAGESNHGLREDCESVPSPAEASVDRVTDRTRAGNYGPGGGEAPMRRRAVLRGVGVIREG